MEIEIENKIFLLENYISKENMEEHVKEYIIHLKKKYPNACVTREFYKGQNILVRATEVYNKVNKTQKEKEKEVDDWHIRQRGGR